MLKTLVSFAVLLALSETIFGQWLSSGPEVVALQDEWGNLRPRIALDANSSPLVIWTRPSDHTVMFSRKDGGVFSAPLQISPMNLHILGYDWYGPEISSNGNDVYVVFKEMPEETGPIHLIHSGDGGLNWNEPIVVDSSAAIAARMPAIAAGPDGLVYVAYMREDVQAGISEWIVVTSNDFGNSFSDPVSVTAEISSAVCDCCPASIAVNGDLVAFIYRNNEADLRDIRAAISQNGAASFDSNADMDNMNWVLGACPSTGPSARWNGPQLQTAWMSAASGDNRVYFSSVDSAELEALNQQIIHLAPENESQNYPSLDGDDNITGIAGELLISGQRNIFFSVSDDEFQSESYYVLTSEEVGNQVRPHMKYDGTGFHLVYSDNGGDAVSYRYISQSTGALEIADTDIQVFPQPVINIARLSLPNSDEIISIELFNLLGQTMTRSYQINQDGWISINMDHFPSGPYVLSVTTSNQKFGTTLIKE